ncbi:MAG: acyl carrier protein [Nautiliaceae bacterium]
MDNLREKIKNIMEDIFKASLKNIKDEDIKEENIENWDSLNHVNLMMRLEQEFNIKFL